MKIVVNEKYYKIIKYSHSTLFKCKLCRRQTLSFDKLQKHLSSHEKDNYLLKIPNPLEFMEQYNNVLFYSNEIK